MPPSNTNRPPCLHMSQTLPAPAAPPLAPQTKPPSRLLTIAIWEPHSGGRTLFATKFKTPINQTVFVTKVVLRRITTCRHHVLEISLAAGLHAAQSRSISSLNTGVGSALEALRGSSDAPKEFDLSFEDSTVLCKITPTLHIDMPDAAFAMADWVSAALSGTGSAWIDLVQVRRYVQVAIQYDAEDGTGQTARWITDVEAALVRRTRISDITAISRSPFAFNE